MKQKFHSVGIEILEFSYTVRMAAVAVLRYDVSSSLSYETLSYSMEERVGQTYAALEREENLYWYFSYFEATNRLEYDILSLSTFAQFRHEFRECETHTGTSCKKWFG